MQLFLSSRSILLPRAHKSRDATKGGDVRSAVHDGAHNASFSFGQHGDLAQQVKIVVDGAWRKENFQGVAAWCMRDSNAQSCANGFTHVYAMSSIGVEALAILQALRWAKMKEFQEVTLLTDSLEVVCALSNVNCANVSIRNVILDILDVVLSLDYVNVTKAIRQDIKDAHNLAWSRLCNYN